MKSRVCLVLLTLVLLGTCAASSQSPVVGAQPQGGCVVSAQTIQVSGWSAFTSFTEAQILTPNANCRNLPVLYCVYHGAGYGGGLSCTPVKSEQ